MPVTIIIPGTAAFEMRGASEWTNEVQHRCWFPRWGRPN